MDNPNQVPIRKTSSTATVPSMKRSKSTNSTVRMGVIALSVIVILVIGFYGIKMINHNEVMKGVNSSEYQAVFLTNGQAYFGKITDINGNYLTIKNIYYLQAGQTAQPKDTASTSSTPLSLVKLGSEIHGPEDQMNIARSQILFYENLKNNSQVVQAIQKH
jgi:hypothetical protein